MGKDWDDHPTVPGSIRIRSKGYSVKTRVEVLQRDGSWIPLRLVTRLKLTWECGVNEFSKVEAFPVAQVTLSGVDVDVESYTGIKQILRAQGVMVETEAELHDAIQSVAAAPQES
jgi:hypothetical protein